MNKSICPWWMGYVLMSPLRKHMHDPNKILGDYIKPGMKVIDYGSAMGYFSLPIAYMVGSTGKVYSFDIQDRMLQSLKKRAKKKKLDSIIEEKNALKEESFTTLSNTADFALLFAVAHEVPDRQKLFNSLAGMLKTNGQLLFAEPAGHVSKEDFEDSISLAQNAGFSLIQPVNISKSNAALLTKR